MKTRANESRRFPSYEPPSSARVARAATIEAAPWLSPGGTAHALPEPLVLQRCAPRAVRKHRNRGVVRWAALLVGDVAALLLSRQILLAVRDQGIIGPSIASAIRLVAPRGSLHVVQLMTAVLLGLAVFGTYGPGDRRRDIRATLAAAGAGVMLVSWAWLWDKFSWYHLAGCGLVAAGLGGALVVERTVIDLLVRRIRGARKTALRSIVIGPARTARSLLDDSALDDPTSFHVIGYVDIAARPEPDALGSISDLVAIIDEHRVDTLILNGDCDAALCDAVLDIADAANCQVLVAPHWTHGTNLAPQVVWQRGTPLVALMRPALRGQQLMLKRAFDVTVASVMLILLMPLLLLIALAVRLSSPGPIFFSQVRIGQGGRQFRIYKFRSMVHDAEARRTTLTDQSIYRDERLFKIKNDPRVTPVGRFLRRTSLDELPQLWNVLRGEMSLVGPRPPLPSEVQLYSERHYARFHMKPGITGPWQVRGRNNVTDFEEVMRLESAWMRQWSIGKDFAILLETVPVVLKMDGAH